MSSKKKSQKRVKRSAEKVKGRQAISPAKLERKNFRYEQDQGRYKSE